VENNEAIVAIFSLAIVAGTVLTAVWMALRAKERNKALPRSSAESDQRLQRIEQTVDSIAVEVERIAEAQRFTAKLLASRPGDAEPLPAPRQQR